MKRSGRALGMVMGVGLLASACEPASQLEGGADWPELEASTIKNGSTDPNGTPKSAWHTWKEETVDALRRRLLLDDGTINPEILALGFLNDPEGQEVFDHAFRCAVEPGLVVKHPTGIYTGQGMVAGASDWVDKGLGMDVVYNVLECVIAFVNDKTDGVSILLTGPNVNDTGDHAGFIYSEAVWCADVATTGVVSVRVYATETFGDGCKLDPAAALAQRYCYEEGTCGLRYEGLLEKSGHCVPVGAPEDGHYECWGRPCTMTWLTDPQPPWCRRRRLPD
ncbi:hypothetical protein [Sorangium sp. So ce1078]|uniref:hypothetical protein n=1 Tax=Sorangium sp. So ce1078 TaxID=3133329 RepID=UPI003F61EA6A